MNLKWQEFWFRYILPVRDFIYRFRRKKKIIVEFYGDPQERLQFNSPCSEYEFDRNFFSQTNKNKKKHMKNNWWQHYCASALTRYLKFKPTHSLTEKYCLLKNAIVMKDPITLFLLGEIGNLQTKKRRKSKKSKK